MRQAQWSPPNPSAQSRFSCEKSRQSRNRTTLPHCNAAQHSQDAHPAPPHLHKAQPLRQNPASSEKDHANPETGPPCPTATPPKRAGSAPRPAACPESTPSQANPRFFAEKSQPPPDKRLPIKPTAAPARPRVRRRSRYRPTASARSLPPAPPASAQAPSTASYRRRPASPPANVPRPKPRPAANG